MGLKPLRSAIYKQHKTVMIKIILLLYLSALISEIILATIHFLHHFVVIKTEKFENTGKYI